MDFDRADIYPIGCIDDRTNIMYAKPGTTLADVLAKAKDGSLTGAQHAAGEINAGVQLRGLGVAGHGGHGDGAVAKDGSLKMSGGNPLSELHLALGSLCALEGGKVMVVPYDCSPR